MIDPKSPLFIDDPSIIDSSDPAYKQKFKKI